MNQIKPLFAAAGIVSVLIGSMVTGAALTWRPGKNADMDRAWTRDYMTRDYTDRSAGRDGPGDTAQKAQDIRGGYDRGAEPGMRGGDNGGYDRGYDAAAPDNAVLTDNAMLADGMQEQLRRELASTPDAFNGGRTALDGGPLSGYGAAYNRDNEAGDRGYGNSYDQGTQDWYDGQYFGGGFGNEEEGEEHERRERSEKRFRNSGEGSGGDFGREFRGDFGREHDDD